MTTGDAIPLLNPARASTRIGSRTRLVGAGIAYVWRFGALDFSANSGRLLLRGENGTGKTTALETLWPFLLDLNSARLAAGKGRTTNFPALMREAVRGAKKANGYVWFTVCDQDALRTSYGARLEFSENGSPPVDAVPFRVHGRPLVDLKLKNPDGSSLTHEQFKDAVLAAGGEVFDDAAAYKRYLAKHVFFVADARRLETLAARIRDVRNPSNLLDLSPEKAGDALRTSLPGVASDVIDATAEALAESAATRSAFARDAEAAVLLTQFAEAWTGHATEVLATVAAEARGAADAARQHERAIEVLKKRADKARADVTRINSAYEELSAQIRTAHAEVKALEASEPYRQGGRLTELKEKLLALEENARTTTTLMLAAAREATATSDRFRKQWNQLFADICDAAARAAMAEPNQFSAKPAVTMSETPRARVSAGDVSADAGARLSIHGGAELHRLATAWQAACAAHQLLFDSSSLAITDYSAWVEPAAQQKRQADDVARDKSLQAERDRTEAATAETNAGAAATTTRHAIGEWTRENSVLAVGSTALGGVAHEEAVDDDAWDVDDVERRLASAEPGQTLELARRWQRHALRQSEGMAASWRTQANERTRVSKKLISEAAEAERAAAELRKGKLLPLPRPHWAGAGDDQVALGAALDWNPAFTDSSQRDRVEAALAASGLLGAAVDDEGASAQQWRVVASGAIAERNLLSILTVEDGHPLGDVARAVLERVHLRETVDATDRGLLIGLDGTFRAGVLHASAVVPGTSPSRASHVGARQRHAAAIARAEALEAEALTARVEAERERVEADALVKRAAEITKRGRSFPSLDKLQEAEALRSTAAARVQLSEAVARGARTAAAERGEELRLATAEWSSRTVDCGLPPTIEEVRHLQERSKHAAELLTRSSQDMAKRLPRFDELVDDLQAAEAALSQRLVETEARARAAHDEAFNAATAVRVLNETAGLKIREVLDRIEKVKRELAELEPIEASTKQKADEAGIEKTTAETLLQQAQEQLSEFVAKAAAALQPLHAITKVPGVAEAILADETAAAGEALIEQVERLTRGRKTLTKRALRERHDAVKPKLTGIWTLAPGDDCGELLTYVVSHHHGDTYSPPGAAARALVLRERADKALKQSEEKALAEFVVGRLPSAITTAWVQLQDWRRDVNKQMKEAAASSGVTVQVSLPVVDDLSAPQKTVYDLTCKNDPIDLSDADKKRLGDALYGLIQSTDGTMKEKVEAAVDIRRWVEVVYNVTRPVPGKPGEVKTSPWNSRTGLSSGERRLVVLAPMLAALASAYGQFGSSALRLVALDEIPAEVDERGKEGLARFIAALDLDLICTSHTWDGCPGAWDIDAQDMEAAGEDGTVVANPMLIRGLELLPGDDPLAT